MLPRKFAGSPTKLAQETVSFTGSVHQSVSHIGKILHHLGGEQISGTISHPHIDCKPGKDTDRESNPDANRPSKQACGTSGGCPGCSCSTSGCELRGDASGNTGENLDAKGTCRSTKSPSKNFRKEQGLHGFDPLLREMHGKRLRNQLTELRCTDGVQTGVAGSRKFIARSEHEFVSIPYQVSLKR
jgi:hypothetical protein